MNINGRIGRLVWSYNLYTYCDPLQTSVSTILELSPFDNVSEQKLLKDPRMYLTTTKLFECFQLHPNWNAQLGREMEVIIVPKWVEKNNEPATSYP